jgi:hypothetical protein
MKPFRPRRRVKPFSPDFPADPPERVVCKRHEHCKGCPYPRHGLICWHSDGGCLKTDLERMKKEKEVSQQ